MHEMREAIEYASEWYEYGRNSKDPTVRFVMYWIAFNWLYSEIEGDGDKWKIPEYCKKHHDRLSKYNAFGTQAYEDLVREPVMRMERTTVRATNSYLNRRLREGTSEDPIADLLLTIYQVRCNLFHGSKKRRNMRDGILVGASATIMEGYLGKLLDLD